MCSVKDSLTKEAIKKINKTNNKSNKSNQNCIAGNGQIR
jgi:hypothetical protein